jgi:hypothetical protein
MSVARAYCWNYRNNLALALRRKKITNLPTCAEEFPTFLQSNEIDFGLHIMWGTGSDLRDNVCACFLKRI